MLDFIEPNSSKPMVHLVKFLWPFYVFGKYGRLKIELLPGVNEAFNRLHSKTVVICPNHSSSQDPDVLFGISRLVKENFQYLAAREIFGSSHGGKCWCLQKLGCFSIERGEADIHAVKAVHEVLLQDKAKLVIFPEGEVSHQNDHLMHLGNGAERIALNSLREAKKRGLNHQVYILPLSLHYEFSKDISVHINKALDQIEKALGISGGANNRWRTRIKNCLIALLASRLGYSDNNDLEQKLADYREKTILEASSFLKLELPDNLDQLSKLHLLKNRIAEIRWGQGKDYFSQENKIQFFKLRMATELYGIGEHSFTHELSKEEAAELLYVIEYEIFHKHSIKNPDMVKVSVAPEIEVGQYLILFEKNRETAVQSLRRNLKQSLEECHKKMLTESETCLV